MLVNSHEIVIGMRDFGAFKSQAHGAFSFTHTFQYGQTHTNNKTHHVNWM
jgi:hypothetical protein